MNITIWLAKVEYEMLKELQKKDDKCKKRLEEKVGIELKSGSHTHWVMTRLILHIGKEKTGTTHIQEMMG